MVARISLHVPLEIATMIPFVLVVLTGVTAPKRIIGAPRQHILVEAAPKSHLNKYNLCHYSTYQGTDGGLTITQITTIRDYDPS